MKILVLFAVHLLAGVYSQQQNPVIEVIAERHGSAVLECSQRPGRCTLFHATELKVDREGAPDPRYSVRDGQSCTIVVSDLRINDSASYICTDSKHEKKEFRLLVTVMPEEPKLENAGREVENNSRSIIEPNINGGVQFECHSNQGYPNSTINWYVDNEFRGHGNIIYASVNDLENVRSVLDVNYEATYYSYDGPAKDVNEKEVRCEVEHVTYKGTPKVLMGRFGRPYITNHARLTNTKGEDSFMFDPKNPAEVVCVANGLPVPTHFVIKRLNEDTGEYEEVAHEAMHNLTRPGLYVCGARNSEENTYQISAQLKALDPEVAGKQTKDQSKTASLVGIILGTIIAIAIVIGVVVFLYRKEKLCFKQNVNRSEGYRQNPGNVENGTKNAYNNEMTNTDKEPKKDGVKGDQNENTKPKEVVYAQLDLAKSNNGKVKPKSPEEKTEYAQLTFQPKENQV